MQNLTAALLVVVGIIHLLPLTGVLGSGRLTKLYGLPFEEPNLAILMRHRAVLFGMLGALLVYAAFEPKFQPLALVGGYVSVVSFLWLARSVGQNNACIARVVRVDVVALFGLLVATGAYVWTTRHG